MPLELYSPNFPLGLLMLIKDAVCLFAPFSQFVVDNEEDDFELVFAFEHDEQPSAVQMHHQHSHEMLPMRGGAGVDLTEQENKERRF